MPVRITVAEFFPPSPIQSNALAAPSPQPVATRRAARRGDQLSSGPHLTAFVGLTNASGPEGKVGGSAEDGSTSALRPESACGNGEWLSKSLFGGLPSEVLLLCGDPSFTSYYGWSAGVSPVPVRIQEASAISGQTWN